jgi:DnaJ family protein C protein 3
LALGKAKQALLDFDKVLQLKPDFTAARIQRGQVHLKNGDLDFAEDDLSNAVSLFFPSPLYYLN